MRRMQKQWKMKRTLSNNRVLKCEVGAAVVITAYGGASGRLIGWDWWDLYFILLHSPASSIPHQPTINNLQYRYLENEMEITSCFFMGPRWLIYPILSYPNMRTQKNVSRLSFAYSLRKLGE